MFFAAAGILGGAILEAVAAAGDGDDLGVAQEAIKNGGGLNG